MSKAFSLRSYLVYSATIVVILLALGFSLLRVALPHAHGYVSELEARLTEQVGLPVDIGSLDAEMHWFTPRLLLLDTRIRDDSNGEALIAFARIELSLSWVDSIRFMSPKVDDINLVLDSIHIERLDESRWRIQGLELAGSDEQMPDDLRYILENTSFSVLGKRVVLIDHTGVYEEVELADVDIHVAHSFGEHSLITSIPLPEKYGEALVASVRYSGKIESVFTNQTEVFVDIKAASIERWLERVRISAEYSVQGRHDLRVWMTLTEMRPNDVIVQVASRDLVVDNSKGASWRVDALSGVFKWRQHKENWQLSIEDLNMERAGLGWRMPSNIIAHGKPGMLLFSADYLNLQDLQQLVDLLAVQRFSDDLQVLRELDAQTELYNVNIAYDPERPMQSGVEFVATNLGLRRQGWQLSGLDLVLRYNNGLGSMNLVGQNAQVVTENMFRAPVAFDGLRGVVDVAREGSEWRFGSDQLSLRNADLDLRARVSASWSDEDGLWLDMQARLAGLQGAAASRYYPVPLMNAELVSWLDGAIGDGRINDAYFSFYGRAADYPFDRNGSMWARFDVAGMNLKFDSDWPVLEGLAANVLFDNSSLIIRSKQAAMYDARLKRLTATIADLNAAVLDIEGVIDTPLRDIQQVIWNSPLDSMLGAGMNQLRTEGNASLNLVLKIPLATEEETSARGEISFNDSVIVYPDMSYRLESVKGVLGFAGERMYSKGLTAKLDDASVAIDIETSDDDRGAYTDIHFNGDIDIDSLLARFEWVSRDWLSASSPWDIRITIPHYQGNNDVVVDASSSLRGTVARVSDVLQKQAATPYPLHVAARIDGELIAIDVELPDAQHVNGRRDAKGNWTLDVKTSSVAGKAVFHESLAANSEIQLEFERLDLTTLTDRSKLGGSGKGLMPGSIPSIRFSARDVEWRRWRLDQVAFNSANNVHGMLISDIELSAPGLKVSGSGTWLSGWRHPHETTMTLSVESPNLGDALQAQGFKRVIDRCRQQAELVLQWPAEPFEFSWLLLSGTADIELANGILTDVDAGTGGRLVGLLNVFHLPRRLMFDFSDIKQGGFGFDTISSKLTFADGFARTDNTIMQASVADMRINGSVDMEDELYDVQVRVKPNQSAATFTGGAIAGGPVVGAGLVLLQKLLNLDKASQDRYAITGSWDDPVVTLVKKAEPVADTGDGELTDDE